ncbi:MAG TPA: DUF4893 domain-containing protein [Allosphingosinicella sp.]|jgi:hypothetical protein
MIRACLALCSALALAGCSRSHEAHPQSAAAAPPDWRSIATEDDRARIRDWRSAWVEALRRAQAAGFGTVIAREGALLQPDAAAEWQDFPDGVYRCRTIKIGGQRQGMLDYVAYPAFDCRVRREDGLISFAKLTGSQRPIGYVLPTAGERMIFLGTLQLGDETRALEYGRDRERDMAGIVERIGERRWRLVFPRPHFESMTDILELVPAGSAP